MSGFFVFDIETLSTESTAVVLSAAIVYVDLTKESHTWESLYSDSLFVKFSVEEQAKTFKRLIEKSALDWWEKQCDITKKLSLYPKKSDLDAKSGIQILRKYITEHADPAKTLCWIRGSIDQLCIDSLAKNCGEEAIFPYANYRDVRTYVDIVATNPVRGYCGIDKTKYPGYDRNKVIKHDPISDICLDALMILYPE